jgi:hypothetical protein
MKEFLKKGDLMEELKIEQNNHSILANGTEWAPSSHHLLWLLYSRVSWLVLSSLIPLCAWIGLRPPAKISTLSHYHSASSSSSVQNTISRRRSLFMRVLSHSDTHNLNGYIGWCGCHAILIALCYPKEVFCLDQKKSQGNRHFESRW